MEALSLPFLYRVHAAPDLEKMMELNQLLASFGVARPPMNKQVCRPAEKKNKAHRIMVDTNSVYSSEIASQHVVSPKDLSRVLEQTRGRPEEKLIHETILRSMQKACYSEKNIGHFGLASNSYTHFTSPVRRYPDLVVHRLLKRTLGEGRSFPPADQVKCNLPLLVRHLSERERVSVDAEREAIKRKTIRFMEDKVGHSFRGKVSGVTSFGFFVELDLFFVEGLVHVTTLEDDYYVYNERHHCYIGRHRGRTFQLGDRVDIIVERANLNDMEIRFRPAVKQSTAPQAGNSLR